MKTVFIENGKIVSSVVYFQGEPGCSLPYEVRVDYENDLTPGEPGWDASFDSETGVWTFTPPEQLANSPRLINVVLWLSRFTPQERVAIRAARANNPIIDDFWLMLEDVRLPEIDLNLSSVEAGIDYLISQNLLQPERKASILE